MKKYFASYLSSKERGLILERINRGEKVSRISRETKVSRTTLYKWLKSKSLGVRDLSRRMRRKKISVAQRRKMIKIALKYPNYPIRKISSLSGLSVGFVWSVMKKHSLNTMKQRQAHFLAKGISLYKNVRGIDKVMMIDRYMAGDSVTRICSDYSISRTIFYKWIHKCNSEGDKYSLFNKSRPKGSSHWRFITGMEGIVRNLVASNPELSLSELHNRIKVKHMNMISRSGLYYVCKRLELTTYEKRLIYAQSGSAMGIARESDASLFIQLVVLSLSSLVLGFWVLVLGRSIMKYEPASKVEVNRRELERQVYEKRQESEEIVYIVKAGDSLWHISEQIFGSGYNWVDVARVNRLPNPDLIDIGQRLVIPVVGAKEITLDEGKSSGKSFIYRFSDSI